MQRRCSALPCGHGAAEQLCRRPAPCGKGTVRQCSRAGGRVHAQRAGQCAEGQCLLRAVCPDQQEGRLLLLDDQQKGKIPCAPGSMRRVLSAAEARRRSCCFWYWSAKKATVKIMGRSSSSVSPRLYQKIPVENA